MAADYHSVYAFVADNTDVLKKQQQIEDANRKMAKIMGSDFSRVAKVIGQDFDKMGKIYKKAIDPKTGKEYLRTIDSTGQKVQLLNGTMGVLTSTVTNQGKKTEKTAYSFRELSSNMSDSEKRARNLSKHGVQLATNFGKVTDVNKKFAKELKDVGTVSHLVRKNLTKVSGNTKTFGSIVATSNGKILQLNETIKKTPGGVQKVSRSVQDVTSKYRNMGQSADKLGKKTVSLGENMKRLAKRAAMTIPLWLVLRGSFMAMIRLFKNSVKFLIDWEYQMAQLAIVGKITKVELEALSNSMLNLSTSLGISNKALGEAGKLYLQQGRAIKEIIPLMGATAKLSLLTGRTIVQSVEDMTSILKAYKLEASDAINVVDGITSVMLSHAIQAGDLAAAYKQVASSAASLGVSFSALTGFITAIKTVTRDAGSKIGLSLRTMFSRISTTSAKALQTLTGIPFFLKKTGEVTKDITPNMRNLEDILFEMAGGFDKLTNAQQSQVAKLIGGIRRTNQVFALFNNFTEAIDAQTDSLFGLGKADEAIGILTDTTKLRIEKLSGAWSEFVDAIGDMGIIKDALTAIQYMIASTGNLLNPSRVLAVEVGKRYDEQIKSLSRQKKLVDSILKSIARAKSLEEMLGRGGGNIELIQRQIQSLVKGINEVGGGFDIKIGSEIKDPTKLITELKEQFDKLEALTIQAKIEIPVREISKETALLGTTIFNEIEQSILKGFKLDKVWNKETKEISNILQAVSLGSIIDEKEINKLKLYIKALSDTKRQEGLLSLVDKIAEKQEKINNLLSGERKIEGGLLKIAEQKNSLIETEFQLNHRLNRIRIEGTKTGRFEVDILNDQLSILNKQKDALSDELFQKRITIEQKIEKIYYKQGQNIKKIILANQITQLKNAGALESKLLKQKDALLSQFGIQETITQKLERRLSLEEAINKEKELGHNISSKAEKLYDIAVEHGSIMAGQINEVVSGQRDFNNFLKIGGERAEILKEKFAREVKEEQMKQFFRGETVAGMPTLRGGYGIEGKEFETMRKPVTRFDVKAQAQLNITVNAEGRREIVKIIQETIVNQAPQVGSKINKALAETVLGEKGTTF